MLNLQRILILIQALCFSSWAFSSNESPQSFTLDGTLLAADHMSPLLDSTAKVRVQVLNPAKTCVLYDEEQTVNTFLSNGRFNIQVGSAVGSAKRKTLDSANTMAKVYQNTSVIAAQAVPSQTCAGSSYTPAAGDIRYVRLIVTPTSSSPETLTPDMVLDAVPSAVVAQSLQGVEKAGFLQVNSSALLTQAKLEQFMQTLTTVPGMGVVYDGTNFQSYDPKNGGLLSAGSVTDTQISSLAWAKITGAPGGLSAFAALSCANGKILKMVSGAWDCADESGVGSESDPTVAAYAKNAPGLGLTVSGGAIVADFGTGAGKVVQGNDSRLSDSRAPNGSAGGDLSGSYPSPTVAKIQGRGVSVTAPADGQVLRYNNGASQWEPYNFGIGDLKTNAGTPQFISASCTASETLIWSSVTNTFSCTTIAINASQVSGNIAGNAANVTGTVAIANGGTGQTTAVAALNALLPAQSGANGKVLQSDGTNVSWQTVSGGGSAATLNSWQDLTASRIIGTSYTNSTSSPVVVSVIVDAIGIPQQRSSLVINGTTVATVTPSDYYSTVAATSHYSTVYGIVPAGATYSIQNYGGSATLIGWYESTFSGTGAGVPAGSTGSIQFNSAGAFASDADLIWNNTTKRLGVGVASPTVKLDVNGTINATGMTINGVPVGTSTGVTSLNGSSQATQTFATPGVTGTAPNWSTNTGTGAHTLNIPMANTASVTAGLISKTEYDTFNNKLSSSYALAGDVTGTPAATVVDRIKGVAVSAAPSSTGQILRYNGSQLAPAFLSMFDLRSTLTGAQAFGGVGCLSNQTLTWTAASDNLACSNISLPASQVTGTLPIAQGGTGATTAAAAAAAILPSQASNSGKVLTTDGTNLSWSAPSGGGGSASSVFGDQEALGLMLAEMKGSRINVVSGIYDPLTALTDVDVAGSSNIDTSTGGKILGAITYSANIAGLGTAFASASVGGAYTAASTFDGVTANNNGFISNAANPPTGAYVGLDFGAGVTKDIRKITVWNGTGLSCPTYCVSPNVLEYSDNGSTYTQVGSNLTMNTADPIVAETFTFASAGAHRYWRLRTATGSNGRFGVTEMLLYERMGAANFILKSNAFTASASPDHAVLTLQANPVDAITLNTDLVGSVSRDGGTTWTTATLVLKTTLADGTKLYMADAIDISAQPSGTSLKWRVQNANNKNVEISGIGLRWY